MCSIVGYIEIKDPRKYIIVVDNFDSYLCSIIVSSIAF